MRPFILLLISCVVFRSNLVFANSEFINLSRIDLEVNVMGEDHQINFLPPDLKISCSPCNISEYQEIKCQEGDLVDVKVEMKNERIGISVPFNISCKSGKEAKNLYEIQDITTQSGINDLSLSWRRPHNEIIYYQIYFFNGTNQIKEHTQNAQNNSFFMSNLKEKTWYQICIATVDVEWRTGTFVCKQVLTDFSVTGPVTNVSAKSEIDKIFISWSKSQYELDIPHGYVVHLKGPQNFCQIVIIKMMEVDIPNDEKCSNNFITLWSSLKTLEIKGLNPYSEFQIQIIPLNGNKKSAKTSLSIKTKEGESNTVEDLRLDTSSPGHLLIVFLEPSRPRGKILKYRIKITSTKIHICSKGDTLEKEIYFNNTKGSVNLDVLKHCGLYLIEVTPVNGWGQNGGFGKPASIPYEHLPDQTSLAIDVRNISVNTIKVRVSNWSYGNRCPIDGVAITIQNENDKKDCTTRIVANETCDELKHSASKIHNCSYVEFVKFSNQSPSLELFFSRMFQYQNKFAIVASRIIHKIEKVNSINIKPGNNEECFTDCFDPGQFYPGLRSVTKHETICENWNRKPFEAVRSNICYSHTKGLQCLVQNIMQNCDVPQCSTIDYGTACVKGDQKNENWNSVEIHWHPPDQVLSIIGYLTLLHNTDHFCEQYQLQLKENSITETQLDNSIKGFYLSCKSGNQFPSISNIALFKDLHQNRTFFVYIIPIISESKSGGIMNLTVQTSLAKPDVPKFSMKSESLSEIEISWEKEKETKEHGAASYYLLKLKETQGEPEMPIYDEAFKMKNLEMCTKYCFLSSGVNNGGSSKFSKEICSHTLAPSPKIVKLQDLGSGYSSSQTVTWAYLGSDRCTRTYRVEYWQKHNHNKKYISTNESSAVLKDLKPNVIYVVRVRAEGLMKTLNNESLGEYSAEKQFYTRFTFPNVTYFNESLDVTKLNISWGITEQMKGAISEFIILLKDSSKKCKYLVYLKPNSSDELPIQSFLNEKQNKNRDNLLKCKLLTNKTVSSDKMNFSYFLELEEAFSNFSVEIYGTNLMGVQLMSRRSSIIQRSTFKRSVKSAVLIPIFAIILVAIVALLIAWKLKDKKYLSVKLREPPEPIAETMTLKEYENLNDNHLP